MATSKAETITPPPGTDQSPQPQEPGKHSMEEAAILGHIHELLGGHEQFSAVLLNEALSDEQKARQMAIIESARMLIARIRKGENAPDGHALTSEDFFAYQDAHFDDPDYAFLIDLHPGLNSNGWRLLLAEMDPVKWGKSIERPMAFDVHATISKRSAKS